MAQAATARRAAERAARDRLAGPLITAVGELGVAVAQRETAAAGVSDAEERAREHVRRAQVEAQEMVAAARAQVAAAEDAYRAAHLAGTLHADFTPLPGQEGARRPLLVWRPRGPLGREDAKAVT